MDNYSQPIQPAMPTQSPIAPVPPVQPNVQQPANGAQPVSERPSGSLAKTIAIIIISLAAATFIGLFIWMYLKYQDASTDLESQIDIAVADAVAEQTKKLENEFAEREKNPYKTFAGPADYGQLGFEYPKTWSVYVAADASNGGDYEAYFNPIQVDTVSKNTINALRLTIRDDNFDTVAAEYQKAMDKKNSNLTVSSITINGITANRYTGTIPNTELSGYIVIFKIRDKTAILQTDSVLFKSDFDTLLETITFNS